MRGTGCAFCKLPWRRMAPNRRCVSLGGCNTPVFARRPLRNSDLGPVDVPSPYITCVWCWRPLGARGIPPRPLQPQPPLEDVTDFLHVFLGRAPEHAPVVSDELRDALVAHLDAASVTLADSSSMSRRPSVSRSFFWHCRGPMPTALLSFVAAGGCERGLGGGAVIEQPLGQVTLDIEYSRHHVVYRDPYGQGQKRPVDIGGGPPCLPTLCTFQLRASKHLGSGRSVDGQLTQAALPKSPMPP